jgi:hypothetical protein
MLRREHERTRETGVMYLTHHPVHGTSPPAPSHSTKASRLQAKSASPVTAHPNLGDTARAMSQENVEIAAPAERALTHPPPLQ